MSASTSNIEKASHVPGKFAAAALVFTFPFARYNLLERLQLMDYSEGGLPHDSRISAKGMVSFEEAPI